MSGASSTIKKCHVCNREQDETDEAFCTICGARLQVQATADVEPSDVTIDRDGYNKSDGIKFMGWLVMPDGKRVIVDESQLLLGRAYLRTYTALDPYEISRSHLTIYYDSNSSSFVVVDGVTNVQDRPSRTGTLINNNKLTQDHLVILNNGDIIKISDVEMRFERS